MKQIDSDQIIVNDIPDNTINPIPRDLGPLKASVSGKSGLSLFNISGSNGNLEFDSAPPTPSVPLPDTPNLIGIKSQTVKIKEDGTYVVDVIIEVENVRNVSDYEVRISKSAGNV